MKWKDVTANVKGRKPTARGYHSMTLVESKAIVFGGSDGTECFSDVHILDMGLYFRYFLHSSDIFSRFFSVHTFRSRQRN